MFEKKWTYMQEAGEDGAAGGVAADVGADAGVADVGVVADSVDTTATANVAIDWRTGLPEEFKEAPALQDFKDVGGLAKAYMDSKSAMGKMVKLPSDEAGDDARAAFRERMLEHDKALMVRPDPDNEEQMAAYYESIGIPEESTPYLEVIEQPEGLEFDDARMAEFAAIAHANKIPPKQFGKAMSAILAADAQAFGEAETSRVEGINTLKTEWAGAYDEKVNRASTVAELTNAPQALVDSVKNGKAGAETLRWLDKLATSIGSEGNEVSKQVGNIGADTLEDTTQKRDDLLARMINEKMTHQEYSAAQKRLDRYNRSIAGDGVVASSGGGG